MRLSFEKLKEEQLKIAKKVVLKDSFEDVITLGGADCAFFENKIVASVIVCDRSFAVLEKQHAVLDLKIPYIPGLLFYREGPAIAEAFSKLEHKPTVLMCDGNGILHPLRIGLASHLGVLLDQPTIGISKNLLCGNVEHGKVRLGDEILGREVKTKEHARPLYVSPGHNISMKTSVELVSSSIKPPHKLPEPLHLAHKEANTIKNELTK